MLCLSVCLLEGPGRLTTRATALARELLTTLSQKAVKTLSSSARAVRELLITGATVLEGPGRLLTTEEIVLSGQKRLLQKSSITGGDRKTVNNKNNSGGGTIEAVKNRKNKAGWAREAGNSRTSRIGGAREAVNNRRNNAGGDGEVVTTGAKVLEGTKRMFNVRSSNARRAREAVTGAAVLGRPVRLVKKGETANWFRVAPYNRISSTGWVIVTVTSTVLKEPIQLQTNGEVLEEVKRC